MADTQNVVRYSPLHNVVFACIFQDEDKAGKAMLEFLNAVMRHVGEEPIAQIISMASEYSIMGESADQKYGRLDVRVRAESGRLFDIEVQIDREYMNERGFFYGGRMGEDEFKPGTPYNRMPEVRVISLVDFYVREGSNEIVEPVVLAYANNPTEIATRKFMMYHIQLPEFRRAHRTIESVRNDALLTWLYAFDQGYKDPEEMEALSEMSEGLKNFAKRYNYAINDPELIRRYRMVEDGKRDVATRIAAAEEEGRGQGQGDWRGQEEPRKCQGHEKCRNRRRAHRPNYRSWRSGDQCAVDRCRSAGTAPDGFCLHLLEESAGPSPLITI